MVPRIIQDVAPACNLVGRNMRVAQRNADRKYLSVTVSTVGGSDGPFVLADDFPAKVEFHIGGGYAAGI